MVSDFPAYVLFLQSRCCLSNPLSPLLYWRIIEPIVSRFAQKGILLDWNFESVEAFTHGANTAAVAPQAPFVTTGPGHMTTGSLVDDMMACLGAVAGGRHGRSLLALNTMLQEGNILTMLTHIELDPCMQAIMAAHVPARQYLATVYLLMDRKFVNAVPLGRIAPPGAR